ncbi:MAG TPA: hypothetical protein PJ994_12370 [Tepidiformaceae bacterium]|nr:hypothetical protein [Tepidiformaceae bacterium]
MDRFSMLRTAGAGFGITLGLIGAYSKVFTPWQRNWGTTREERERAMPGDPETPPSYFTTRAITVNAPPDAIYPWLVQMGKGRGGLYSWDFLDRLFGFLDAPSAKEILPKFQDLAPGDEIPLSRGANFPVADLRKDEFLLLAGEPEPGIRWTWATVLYPQEDGTTRLVTRNTGEWGKGWQAQIMAGVGDLAAFIMVHRWLHVLKQRAEHLHHDRETATRTFELVAEEILEA